MRYLLVFALLLLAVPAVADDAQDKALIEEALEGYDKVASNDYGDYYVDRRIFRHPGYLYAGYAVTLKHPDEKGHFLMGTYKFDCRGQAQMRDAAYFHTLPSDIHEAGVYLGTSGEEERPDSSMKKIEDPSVAAMEKYACK